MGRAVVAGSVALVQALLVAACTSGTPRTAEQRATPSSAVVTPTRTATPSQGSEPEAGPSALPSPSPAPGPAAHFDSAAAMAEVRLLAGRIGPRLATGPAFRRAGRVVERRLENLGYGVRRESFDVPAGESWGVPVAAGRSFNVVAEPRGFDPARPYVLVGAHLDTVAVAPGAEDNASGVAVLLEVARLAAAQPTRLPVVLVAFGAEEPRGDGDDMHHFGSRHYVEQMSPDQRESLRAMVSLDRVGVGSSVPVCTGPMSPARVQRELLRAAALVDVPARPCENTASDHWSFEKVGFVVARLGSTSYAAYHSAADRPGVVSRWQLDRTGRLVWAWLRGG